MMTAKAYDVDEEGKTEVVCTISFDGKNVTFEGLQGIVRLLQKVELGDRMWEPKDGKGYMEALGKAFKGSRFFVNLETAT